MTPFRSVLSFSCISPGKHQRYPFSLMTKVFRPLRYSISLFLCLFQRDSLLVDKRLRSTFRPLSLFFYIFRPLISFPDSPCILPPPRRSGPLHALYFSLPFPFPCTSSLFLKVREFHSPTMIIVQTVFSPDVSLIRRSSEFSFQSWPSSFPFLSCSDSFVVDPPFSLIHNPGHYLFI